jgi:hypothetical protein
MATAKAKATKTLYHAWFEGDNVGEADGFFEIKDGKLEFVDGWSANDANWRDEYMTGLLEWAGVELKTLPEKYRDEAEKILEKRWGLDYSGEDEEDEEDENEGAALHCRLYYDEGTSDKVYELDLYNEDGWRVVAHYGRRTGTLKEEVKSVGLSFEDAKTVYEQVKNQKLKKGYYQ